MRKTKKASVAIERVAIDMPLPEMLAIASIHSAPYNPHVMSAQKMAALKASLLKSGFVLNIVVQRHSEKYGDLVMVGGHQRLTALREICTEHGWPEPTRVPAIVRDLTDDEAKELNVALNNIGGEFEPYKLGALFESIHGRMTGDDILATGFTSTEVDQLVALVREPDPITLPPATPVIEPGIATFAKSVTLSVEFESVEQRDQVKQILVATGGGVKAGAVVLDALRAAWAAGKVRQNGKRDARRKVVA